MWPNANRYPQLAQRWRSLYAFIRFTLRGFVNDNGLRTASALAYTTLLSLVPLFTVIYSMLSAFPAFQEVEENIREFIFANFVPASGTVVQNYLLSFTQKTSKLTSFGIGFLIISALLMLKTIDNAFNSLWGITRRRSPMASFIVYWAILTLGPLLIGAGVFVTSSLLSLPWFKDLEISSWLALLPFISSSVAFTLFYIIVPNRPVPWRNAVLGALIAAALFGAAKTGFALYVSNSTANETIYGALAVIPFFLGWIYLSWVIILLGAQITYALTVFNWHSGNEQIHEVDNNFMLAYRLIGHLWEAQCRGDSIQPEQLMLNEHWDSETALMDVVHTLEKAQWVGRMERNRWVLLRDLGELRLVDLYRLMAGGLHSLSNGHDDAWEYNLRPVLVQLNEHTETVMHMPLKQLYQSQEAQTAPDKVG